MSTTPATKRQYLIDFVATFCEMYVTETAFIRDIKKIVLLKESLSHHETKKLTELLSPNEQLRLFSCIEYTIEYHIRVILPILEELFTYLPREIQELTKMELRKRELLVDHIVPPSNIFDLTTEITRFVKVKMKQKHTRGSSAQYEEVAASNSTVEHHRSVNATLLLEAIKNILDCNAIRKLFATEQSIADYAENMWRAKIIYQELDKTGKLKKLNLLFSPYIEPSTLEALYAGKLLLNQKRLLTAIISTPIDMDFSTEYEKILQQLNHLFESVDSTLQAAIAYYEQETNPQETSAITKATLADLDECCQRINSVIHLVQLLEKQSANKHLAKKHQEELKKKLTPPPYKNPKLPTVKLTILKPETSSWIKNFNIDNFKQNFPNNSLVIQGEVKSKFILVQAEHGRSLIKGELKLK